MSYIAAFALLYERGIPLVSVNGPIDAYGVLAGAYRRLKAQDRRLLLVCPPQAYPRRIIALLRLPFSLFDSVADAVCRELSAGSGKKRFG